ncbi:MAG: phosphatidylserine decarboxylase [Alphaproteobacteria bacterium]
MHSILGSIRSMLVPIRREGFPFIAIAAFIAVFVGWFWQPVFWFGLLVTLWIVYFFRDPPRVTPLDANLVIAPADGKVSAVTLGVAPKELGLGEQRRRRVSIFMSVFDCHVNRAPLTGTVEDIVYRTGRFLNAELDKASEENERNAVILDTAHGRVAVVQIAGLVARRIVCFVDEGASLAGGERFGLIRFGSRLDVYLPASARVLVAEGQRAIAGETVIATFDDGPHERSVRID